ncbi:hypothetical protein VTO73DRAFT_208 [Trametes versicolor]
MLAHIADPDAPCKVQVQQRVMSTRECAATAATVATNKKIIEINKGWGCVNESVPREPVSGRVGLFRKTGTAKNERIVCTKERKACHHTHQKTRGRSRGTCI